MRICSLSIIVGFLVMLLMVSCAAGSGAVELAAVDINPTAPFSPVSAELDEVVVQETAVAVSEQNVIAEETAVAAEAPVVTEQEIQPALGEPIEEETFGAGAGETLDSAGLSQSNVDIKSQEGRIAFVRENLAKKLAVNLEDVKFLDYKNKIWPDGNLGCPKEGKRYAPAEIPGYLILLLVGEDQYSFHGGAGRIPFLCSDQPAPSRADREIILPPPDTSP